ncbi:Mitomycin resistance protein mcrB [Gluconobacter cerinus]|uniref:Mitomycin resistance protein mcrB n=2 Tax=Gluconobacter cerinus TaxID=38307 RepID=A0A1B6VJD2_9PROT|nr:Mitomycin resistance protein mcrB [Gluconobacter cerinus]
MLLATMVASNKGRAGMSDLTMLKNVGKAALADFAILGITSTAQLASCEPDDLYLKLCHLTQQRHDPCVHDVFAATIHQAKTGAALNWWAFTPARKERMKSGTFCTPPTP